MRGHVQKSGFAISGAALEAVPHAKTDYSFRGMCNRIRGLKEWREIPRDLANKPLVNFEYNPNVAPTEMVPAFLADAEKPIVAKLARFGINRPGRDGKQYALLNARTDTLRRGSFRTLLANRRCVIPAEGFYEWREEEGKKRPYFFYRKDNKPILFAGIWDMSEVKGDQVPSFAILTDEPNELVAPYHDRMPVVLDDAMRWLEPSERPLDNIRVLPPARFAVRPVNPAVNKVSTKDIAAIEAA